MTTFAIVALGLILIRYFFELCLDGVNAAHVRKHADEVPEAFREIMDEATYQKSVRYTLAKARFGTLSDTYSTAVLCTPASRGPAPMWIVLLHSMEKLIN